MYTPSSYPSYVFYFDGSQDLVHKPEDLRPGCAESPIGPFPEMAQGWKWQIWPDEGMHGGPFAPDKTKHRHMFGLPLTTLVYTAEPRVVNGVQRDYFEVWRGGSSEVEQLIASGLVHKVPDAAQLAKFDSTGRYFLDEDARDAAARRYEKRDLTGFERDTPLSPDTASTLTPDSAPRRKRKPGHKEDAEWRTWTFEYLWEMLREGWRQARIKHPSKKRPSFDDVAACVGHSRRDLSRALDKYEHDWETIGPFIRS